MRADQAVFEYAGCGRGREEVDYSSEADHCVGDTFRFWLQGAVARRRYFSVRRAVLQVVTSSVV